MLSCCYLKEKKTINIINWFNFFKGINIQINKIVCQT